MCYRGAREGFGRWEIGSLRVGDVGVAVLKPLDGSFERVGARGKVFKGCKRLVAVLTVRGGRIR